MGICSSCDSSKNVLTSKLILDDGSLLEFSYPISVFHVLQKINKSCFICNSDDMDFDDVVSAVADDDVLLPGQLYFALPLNRLKRRLRPEEMAALAVKASSALSKNGVSGICGEDCGNVRVYAKEKVTGKVADGGGGRRRCGGSGRREKFTAKLSSVAE